MKCGGGWLFSSDGALMDLISRVVAEGRLHMVICSFQLLQAAKLALSGLMSFGCSVLLSVAIASHV